MVIINADFHLLEPKSLNILSTTVEEVVGVTGGGILSQMEEPLVITVPYKRPLYIRTTGELHIDPVIRQDFVVYGLSAEKLSTASTVQLSSNRFIKLSKGLPRGAIFIPIRYSREKKAYMAPAISQIALTLGGQDLPPDVSCDLHMWYITPELEEALREGASPEECAKVVRDTFNLSEEEAAEIANALQQAGVTEEPVRTLLLKALEEEAIGNWHVAEDYGLVVIAKTLICFSEDVDLRPIDAPIISMEMACYLLDRPELSLLAYARSFQPVRGFSGDKARKLLRHLIKQRVPWL